MPFISKPTKSRFLPLLCLALSLLLIPGMPGVQAEEPLTIGVHLTNTNRLNPLVPVERETMSLTALIYEGLVQMDDQFIPQPCLAEKWSVSNNGATWTFTLRNGVTFHDGTPLSANDVVATVNEILRLSSDETSTNKGAWSSLKYFISGISAPDPNTVVIKTQRKCFGFLYAMNFPILPAAQVQADTPSGTGPYVLEQFQPQDSLILSANTAWWGGNVKISELNIIFHADNRKLISSFEYNRVDAIITRALNAAQYQSGTSSLNLSFRTRQLETLLINNSSKNLQDLNIRLAIRYALDIDSISSTLYMGMAQRTNTPLPSGTWMYQDQGQAFRPDKSKSDKLLQDAGWTDSDHDGILDKIIDGKKVNLSLRFYVYEEINSSVRINAANMMADMLRSVGMDIRLEVMSYSLVQERLKAGNYDLCMASYNMDFTPDPGFMLISGNVGNFERYKSDEMDALFKELRATLNRDEYKQKLYQIQTLFEKDCPFICLYYRSGAILTRRLFTNARDIREPEILRGIEK